MNKRSAVLMALGLTTALVVGGIAFASGIGGPAPSDAATTSAGRVDPIVRTKTRTVTVHRTAKPTDGQVVVLNGSPASTSGSNLSGGQNEGLEDAAHESDGSDTFDVDEHESDTGTQDGSGSQVGGSSGSPGGDD